MKPITHLLILALGSTFLVGSAHAYDRQAAVAYGKYWGGFDINGKWSKTDKKSKKAVAMDNDAIYTKIGGAAGCAHFTSQCLIAGGIKFSANAATLQMSGSSYWPQREKETGARTTGIYSSDSRQYSRTLANANNLVMSMDHSRHGGSLESKPYIDSSFWSRVQPGDIFSQFHGTLANRSMDNFDDYFSHVAFITSVVPGNQDIKISGHNNSYSDQPLKPSTGPTSVALGTGIPNWQNDLSVYIVTLPDAPIVKSRQVWQVDNERLTMKSSMWGKAWNTNRINPSADLVQGDGVVVRYTFDTPMNIKEKPDVKINSSYSMQPFTGQGFNKDGWFVGTSSGQNIKNKTWMGKFYWKSLSPAYIPKSFLRTVSIRAKAKDGSLCDTDNILDKFVPGTNSLLNFWSDEQGAYVQK